MSDPQQVAPGGHPRVRALGVPVRGTPGPLNAITDVPGLTVGYVTLVDGDGPLVVGRGPVRTGVTAILPRGAGGVGVPCAAGWSTLNGNGEMTGTTWIAEVGALAVPVMITNTHAVGPVHEGVVRWVVRDHPGLAVEWLLPVVAETWDGRLNDINGGHVRPEHAIAALDAAAGGPVAEGSVGGGTGTVCYGFKGGSGTSSRVVPFAGERYTVGAFVQANFGARRELTVAGVRLGERFPEDDGGGGPPAGAGSVIVVLATDAPLLPHQCTALTRRVPLGLARTGTTGSHFSGDIFLALSTANAGALRSESQASDRLDRMDLVPWGALDPFFTAVVEAVEESVLNALVAGVDTVGRDGHRVPALPVAAVADAFRASGSGG